ncbi:protein of unknown function [Thiomonas sp. Bio17B3]|nr:protein of unknown function [Thiomonas sp. Bio17B3]VDY13427.1 protein of unknown function [Thiomonas sp. OC7]VDY17369.1 protein of unknown function [Thiomonas sp. CB2]
MLPGSLKVRCVLARTHGPRGFAVSEKAAPPRGSLPTQLPTYTTSPLTLQAARICPCASSC